MSKATWAERARELKQNTYALYLAGRDPRVPWSAKALIGLTVAYALSPIDLIPDFVPLLGYLDDLVLVPLGIWLALRMVPPDVWADCQAQAARLETELPHSRLAAVVIVMVWLLGLTSAGLWIYRLVR